MRQHMIVLTFSRMLLKSSQLPWNFPAKIYFFREKKVLLVLAEPLKPNPPTPLELNDR